MSGIVVHHLGMSQSERIVWLCEELELPYTLRRYERTRFVRLAPPEYRALHPMGIAPVVEVDGRMLAESGAIVEYLVNRHGGGRLQPAVTHETYADWLFWFHFANGTIMPIEMMKTLLRAIPWSGYVRRGLKPRSDKAFAMMDARLGEVPWLAGQDFTRARSPTRIIPAQAGSSVFERGMRAAGSPPARRRRDRCQPERSSDGDVEARPAQDNRCDVAGSDPNAPPRPGSASAAA